MTATKYVMGIELSGNYMWGNALNTKTIKRLLF